MKIKLIIILGLLLNATIAISQEVPYPPRPIIRQITFNWSSHLRLASGSDNWPVTWADDDNQYTVWGDGHFPLNTFYWNFSNKWLSADGKHFSLIFTGRKENDSFNLIQGEFTTE